MPRTQKKATLGRPPKSVRDTKRAAGERKADGERLRVALDELSLTQYQAAERSGVPQGHISSIVNGDRALYRDELRRFARIGISADFLLGVSDVLIAPGGSRQLEALEDDVAVAVAAEMEIRHPAPKLGKNQFRWSADGAAILAALFDSMGAVAREASASELARHHDLEDALAIKVAGARLKELGETDSALLRAMNGPLSRILAATNWRDRLESDPDSVAPLRLEFYGDYGVDHDPPFDITGPTEYPYALWHEAQKRRKRRYAPPSGIL